MPDVSFKSRPDLVIAEPELFQEGLADEVAELMSCWVHKTSEAGYEFYRLNPKKEIDISTFGLIEGSSSSKVLIVIAAYPFEDRMFNITERIQTLASRVAIQLGIDPSDVSITFQKVDFDCWTTGKPA